MPWQTPKILFSIQKDKIAIDDMILTASGFFRPSFSFKTLLFQFQTYCSE